jgi:ankyrin repeat protein
VSLLLDKNANTAAVSRDHLLALLYAARHGNTEVVKVLLDRGCNAKVQNQAGNNALVFACISKSVPCVSLLLELEPETNAGASAATGAVEASAEGDVQLFEYLLEVAGDTPGLQDQYRVMMRYALHRGEHNMVKLFCFCSRKV